MNDLVTIIMPSYNTGRFIKETIESVLAQSYTTWELIIVDDCSNDNTDDVVLQPLPVTESVTDRIMIFARRFQNAPPRLIPHPVTGRRVAQNRRNNPLRHPGLKRDLLLCYLSPLRHIPPHSFLSEIIFPRIGRNTRKNMKIFSKKTFPKWSESDIRQK